MDNVLIYILVTLALCILFYILGCRITTYRLKKNICKGTIFYDESDKTCTLALSQGVDISNREFMIVNIVKVDSRNKQ